MTELKPCPFCGGSDIRIEKIYDYYEVLCCDCLSRTEEYPTNEEAIEAWNHRSSSWHKGTPTENGWYLIKYKHNGGIRYIAMENPSKWVFINDDTLEWQKIEP